MCRIPIIFNDIEKKLDYNTNNYEFLKCYHAKLLPYLVEIFDVNKESIDIFFWEMILLIWGNIGECHLNRGEKWLVKLKESFEYRNYLKKLNGEKKDLDFCYK